MENKLLLFILVMILLLAKSIIVEIRSVNKIKDILSVSVILNLESMVVEEVR